MPEQREGDPTGTGEPGGETPPESRPGSGATPAGGAPSASPSARSAAASEDVDLSDLPEGTPDPVREVIRRERTARREAERQAREVQGRLTERERADMSELQRAQAERDERNAEVQRLQAELRRRSVADEITALAPRVGISDPRLASRLLDMDSLEFDSEGRPKGLQKKLSDLRAEYPVLAARTVGSADAGAAGNGEPAGDDINARIRERIRGSR